MVRKSIIAVCMVVSLVRADEEYDTAREWEVSPHAKSPEESWNPAVRRYKTAEENEENARVRMTREIESAKRARVLDQKEAARVAAQRLVRGQYDTPPAPAQESIKFEGKPEAKGQEALVPAKGKTIKERWLSVKQDIADAWRKFRMKPQSSR